MRLELRAQFLCNTGATVLLAITTEPRAIFAAAPLRSEQDVLRLFRIDDQDDDDRRFRTDLTWLEQAFPPALAKSLRTWGRTSKA